MLKEDFIHKYKQALDNYRDERGINYIVKLPEVIDLSPSSTQNTVVTCITHSREHTFSTKVMASAVKKCRRLVCCVPKVKEGFTLEHMKSLIDSKRQEHYDYKIKPTSDGRYLGNVPLKITCNIHTNTVIGKFSDLITRKVKGRATSGILRCCTKETLARTLSQWKADIKHDKLCETGEPYSYKLVTSPRVVSTDRLTVICPAHGPKEVYAFAHLTSKLSCCRFQGTGHRVSKEYIIRNMQRLEPQHLYEVEMGLSFPESRVWVICDKHGRSEIDTKFCRVPKTMFNKGNFCKECTEIYHSGTEQKLVAALRNRYGEFLTLKVNLHLKGHGQKRLDLYLPKYRLGIEVNGVYWHSEEKKGRNAHVEKRRILAEYGIPLLQFTDLEIEQKLPIVISMINSRMGKNKVHYARKFEVEPITPQEAKQFFNDNHISGFIPAARYLGMRSSTGAVVCAASFGVPRFNKSAQWELLRFATLRGHTIVGALSRIVKNFLRTLDPGTTLISYADLRYGTGDAYAKSGFHLLRENPPGYGYFRALKYVSRYQCQNKNLPRLLGDAYNPSLSSRENMEQNGWRRLYDAGNILYAIQA